MNITIDIDGEEHLVHVTGEIAGRMGNLRPAFDAIGLRMVRSVQKNLQQGGRPKWNASRRAAQEGGKTMLLSGRLRQSITYESGSDYTDIGSNLLYARIQQTGGLIRPRRKKALTIPLNKEARKIRESVSSLYEVSGLFFIAAANPGSDTIGILAKRKGRGGKEIVPMFTLKREVKIPPRPYLVVQEDDKRYILRTLSEYIVSGRLR